MTIKNGDLPAMAVSTNESICQMTGTLKAEFAGLTKREYFAAMAMQGLLSGVHGDSSLYGSAPEWVKNIAEASIEFSYALLAELERTK